MIIVDAYCKPETNYIVYLTCFKAPVVWCWEWKILKQCKLNVRHTQYHDYFWTMVINIIGNKNFFFWIFWKFLFLPYHDSKVSHLRGSCVKVIFTRKMCFWVFGYNHNFYFPGPCQFVSSCPNFNFLRWIKWQIYGDYEVTGITMSRGLRCHGLRGDRLSLILLNTNHKLNFLCTPKPRNIWLTKLYNLHTINHCYK